MKQPKQTRVRPVDQTRMTPNQLVAWNLSQARRLRWWTQEEAARRLEPFLGERWSKAVFSAAERSVMGGRIRHFTADDLYAFARVFELPISFFLTPAPWVEEVAPSGARETTSHEQGFELCFGLRDEAQDVLVNEALDRPRYAKALAQGARGYGAAASKLVRHLEGLAALQEELRKSHEGEQSGDEPGGGEAN